MGDATDEGNRQKKGREQWAKAHNNTQQHDTTRHKKRHTKRGVIYVDTLVVCLYQFISVSCVFCLLLVSTVSDLPIVVSE